ncbi:MAG: DOMON domain-containing protein [Eubacteriales bacterium]
MKKLIALALVTIMIFTLSLAVSAKDIDKVEAPYFNIKPVIDGVVTAEEWGDVTVRITPTQAASYYCDAGAGEIDISFDLWVRWDETNLYIAVVTNEPDGHSLPAGEGNLWNGDVIQFRADPAGPNGSGDKDAPWSDAMVPNISIGQLTDGTQTSWDFQAAQEVPGAQYKIVVGNGTTTYETAVPHEYFVGKGEANFVYGFAIVRLSAPTDSTYNAWLTWGDGICGPQENDDRVGSNSLTLVKKDAVVIPVVEVIEEAPAEAAPVEAPVTAAPVAAAQTSDVIYSMLIILALVSLAGALVVNKKEKR